VKKVHLGRNLILARRTIFFRKTRYTVLQNSSLVEPYIEIHKDIVRSESPGRTEAWITRQHMETFGYWLRKRCQGDESIDEQLYLLAREPSWNVLTFKGYDINGNTF
jgi:hypothetical protein